MSRAQRLLDLIQVLRRYRHPVSGAALAAELGVSLRTLYRDVEATAGPGFIRGTHTAWRHGKYVFIADEVFPAGPVKGGKDASAFRAYGRLQVIDVSDIVHPRSVALHRTHPEGSPRNVLQGPIVAADDEGTRVRVRVAVPFPLVAEVTRAAAAALEVDRGGDVWVTIKATEITAYPA